MYACTGFLGSPISTLISFENCECDLIAIDCLKAIECIPDMDKQAKYMHSGIVQRRAIKDMATNWEAPLEDPYDWAPLGKTLQSLSIKVWREWLMNNELPNGMFSRQEEFVNASAYVFCEENGLEGKPCYFDKFGEPEQYGKLEEEAVKKYHGSGSRSELKKVRKELQLMRDNPYEMSPYTYLVGFAQLSRITFHLRRHMIDIYEQRVRKIEATITSSSTMNDKILRVSLHVRRGDACGHSLRRFAKVASPLDSPAQLSGVRKCYKTSVYMNALKRVQERVPNHRLVVYVATDHMLSLLDEIKENHRDVYDSMSWKYVDYPRQMFNYSLGLQAGANFIEWAPNKASLGETAMVDVWHLSHGQVFVGHLGSRFGKLSWWQATARHNNFIPFFTVDGHSVCCDIDEACGSVSPAILSMENCLTFSRDDSRYENDNDEYWKLGARVRFKAAADEALTRKRRFRDYRIPLELKTYLQSLLEQKKG